MTERRTGADGPTDRLAPVFRPDTIAVVGASETPGALAAMAYGNLKRDFAGRRYPVNARRTAVQGDRAFRDVAELPEPVDLVLVLVPAADVPDVLERCAESGHRSAYVLSAGFSETGTDAGRDLQARATATARRFDFPVVGPNCNGFLNGYLPVVGGFSLAPEETRPHVGPVAIVSQSGGFGSYIMNRAVAMEVRVGFFASTGNESDVCVSDVLRYAVEQPQVTVVCVFAETIRKPEVFLAAAARALELGKVIVSVTPGSSETVARAALSHTASIVGSSEVYDAVCQQYGIVRARSIEELLDFALVLQDGRRMAGRRIGVVTSSGGAGILVAGNAADAGLEIPELDRSAQRDIGALMPAFASARNPIDTTAALGAMPAGTYGDIVSRLIGHDQVDAVLALTWYGEGPDADSLADIYRASGKPLVPVPTLHPEALLRRGLPAFADPTRAVAALAVLAGVSDRPRVGAGAAPARAARAARARRILAASADKPFLLESSAKQLLAGYGIPVARETACADEDSAVKAALAMNGRVALKVQSYDLPHKSDAAGLALGLETERDIRAAYRRVTAIAGSGLVVENVLVQEMVSSRLELAVGLQRDPVFGPVVAVGLGGVLIEILGPPVLLHVPFSADQALAAIAAISGGRITHEIRGLGPAQQTQLADVLLGLSALAIELPEVDSVDVNPLMVTENGLTAVDALVVAGPAHAPAEEG
jgi:acetate---CoA ligase (ADP-forming)